VPPVELGAIILKGHSATRLPVPRAYKPAVEKDIQRARDASAGAAFERGRTTSSRSSAASTSQIVYNSSICARAYYSENRGRNFVDK
jgi:hypothetical protein